jgi:hypothetical protein
MTGPDRPSKLVRILKLGLILRKKHLQWVFLSQNRTFLVINETVLENMSNMVILLEKEIV